MTTVHTLASGSSGNALVLSCGETHLLIDAGISFRRITTALHTLALSAQDLCAVLVTHAHADHIAGLQTLLKRTALPIHATAQTAQALEERFPGIQSRLEVLEYEVPVQLGCCCVTPVYTSHDVPGSCGFRIDTPDGGVGVLTDSGYVPEDTQRRLSGVDLAVLEANHDVEALSGGPYPYYLKQRILGQRGHLCNEDAARFAVELARSGASEIVLAHLSRENNTPAMAQNAVERALCAAGLSPALSVAPREALSEAYIVSGRAACKR